MPPLVNLRCPDSQTIEDLNHFSTVGMFSYGGKKLLTANHSLVWMFVITSVTLRFPAFFPCLNAWLSQAASLPELALVCVRQGLRHGYKFLSQ
jgi:hypothetical protein